MLVQAFEYERAQCVRLDDFYASSRKHLKTPFAAGLGDAIMERREVLFKKWVADGVVPRIPVRDNR
jgi:hypothetical protein